MSFSMKSSHKILNPNTETPIIDTTFVMPPPKKSRKGSSSTTTLPINIPQNSNAGVGPENRVRISTSGLEDYY